jgi:hypothetical protein
MSGDALPGCRVVFAPWSPHSEVIRSVAIARGQALFCDGKTFSAVSLMDRYEIQRELATKMNRIQPMPP